MMSKKKATVFLILSIIFFECFEARKVGGGGGGFARGGGAARMGGPQQGTGGGAWGGGAAHPPPGGGFGGGQPHFGGAGMPQSNFRAPSGGGPGHFGSGTGLGSASRGSSFKTALAGAAIGTVGGLLAFEAGKAIIKSFDQPFHHENRDYYWGSEYARHGSNEHICTYDFDKLIHETPTVAPPPAAAPAEGGVTTTPTPEQALAKATFPNGTRPKQIVWACKNYEQCCGTDCCPMPQSSVSRASNGDGGSSVAGTIGKAILVLLLIMLIGLIICCCCGLIMYKFCRSTFNSLNPVRTSNEPYDPSKYENQQPPQYGQAAQNYPMQPMMQNQGYPNSAYPAQPQPPAVYPAYPPAPAGYYGAENKY